MALRSWGRESESKCPCNPEKMVTLWGQRAGTMGLSGFLFPLLFLGVAESQLVMSVGPSPVRTTLGSDVLLPCNFTVGEPVSLTKFYLAWAQEGTKVAVYQREGLDYQREVQVFPQELSRGNCSLLLRSVSLGDGGRYTSTIIYTPNKEEKQLELQVTAVPTISIPQRLAVMDTASSFSCHVWGFYPRDVTVAWLRDGQSLIDATHSAPQKNPDGTFNLTLTYTFTPTASDSGSIFSCRVNHSALAQPLQEVFTLDVTGAGTAVSMAITGVCVALLLVIVAMLAVYCWRHRRATKGAYKEVGATPPEDPPGSRDKMHGEDRAVMGHDGVSESREGHENQPLLLTEVQDQRVTQDPQDGPQVTGLSDSPGSKVGESQEGGEAVTAVPGTGAPGPNGDSSANTEEGVPGSRMAEDGAEDKASAGLVGKQGGGVTPNFIAMGSGEPTAEMVLDATQKEDTPGETGGNGAYKEVEEMPPEDPAGSRDKIRGEDRAVMRHDGVSESREGHESQPLLLTEVQDQRVTQDPQDGTQVTDSAGSKVDESLEGEEAVTDSPGTGSPRLNGDSSANTEAGLPGPATAGDGAGDKASAGLAGKQRGGAAPNFTVVGTIEPAAETVRDNLQEKEAPRETGGNDSAGSKVCESQEGGEAVIAVPGPGAPGPNGDSSANAQAGSPVPGTAGDGAEDETLTLLAENQKRGDAANVTTVGTREPATEMVPDTAQEGDALGETGGNGAYKGLEAMPPEHSAGSIDKMHGEDRAVMGHDGVSEAREGHENQPLLLPQFPDDSMTQELEDGVRVKDSAGSEVDESQEGGEAVIDSPGTGSPGSNGNSSANTEAGLPGPAMAGDCAGDKTSAGLAGKQGEGAAPNFTVVETREPAAETVQDNLQEEEAPRETGGNGLKQPPEVSEIFIPKSVTEGEETTLSCRMTGHFPGVLSMAWLRRGSGAGAAVRLFHSPEYSIDFGTPHTQDGKSFQQETRLSFTPSVQRDQGAEYVCQVGHVALKAHILRHSRELRVAGRSDSAGSEVDESQEGRGAVTDSPGTGSPGPNGDSSANTKEDLPGPAMAGDCAGDKTSAELAEKQRGGAAPNFTAVGTREPAAETVRDTLQDEEAPRETGGNDSAGSKVCESQEGGEAIIAVPGTGAPGSNGDSSANAQAGSPVPGTAGDGAEDETSTLLAENQRRGDVPNVTTVGTREPATEMVPDTTQEGGAPGETGGNTNSSLSGPEASELGTRATTLDRQRGPECEAGGPALNTEPLGQMETGAEEQAAAASPQTPLGPEVALSEQHSVVVTREEMLVNQPTATVTSGDPINQTSTKAEGMDTSQPKAKGEAMPPSSGADGPEPAQPSSGGDRPEPATPSRGGDGQDPAPCGGDGGTCQPAAGACKSAGDTHKRAFSGGDGRHELAPSLGGAAGAPEPAQSGVGAS